MRRERLAKLVLFLVAFILLVRPMLARQSEGPKPSLGLP
jgi:hypothetical protein